MRHANAHTQPSRRAVAALTASICLLGSLARSAPAHAAGPLADPPSVAPLYSGMATFKGRHVTLRTDCPDRYAKKLLGRLDHFYAQAWKGLTALLDTPEQDVPITVVVYEEQRRYQQHARRYAPGLVNNGGYYDGSARTVVTYRYNNAMQLYFHELVHGLLGELFGDHHFTRYTRPNWPVWFDEGIAEYFGSYAIEDGKLRVPAPNRGKLAYLANALQQRRFVRLRQLLTAPASRFSGASMNLYYATAWGLVDFLASDPVRRKQLAAFFRRVRGGEDGLLAFERSFGPDLAALEAGWKRHVRAAVAPADAAVALFDGHGIDDWTVHEGGDWRVRAGVISGQGSQNYNYLIKSDLPRRAFSFKVRMKLERGTAGLILGNNAHGEYPYYYLIDVGRDVVMLRRSFTATRIRPVKQAFADIALGDWVTLQIETAAGALRILVDGREVIAAPADRVAYSLFGLYLYQGAASFDGLQVQPAQASPAWARRVLRERERALVQPAGAPQRSPGSPRAPSQ